MRMLDKSNLAPSPALGLDDFAEQAMSRHRPARHHPGDGAAGGSKTNNSTLPASFNQLTSTSSLPRIRGYQLAGINQVHIAQGALLASVLRSVLRQDPDIILGEIRDGGQPTSRSRRRSQYLMLNAARNDAAGAIAVWSMGVPPFLLASSVILAQAQRLFRKLCTFCRTPTTVEHDTLAANRIPADFFDGATVYEPKGCPKCNDIGYKGRGALMEVLTVSDQVREAIMHGENSHGSGTRHRRRQSPEGGGLRKVRGSNLLQAALEVTGSGSRNGQPAAQQPL